MSDSHIYELEDIFWDDFSISDDHLVPHPNIKENEGSTFQAESHKKLKPGVRMTSGTGTGSYGVEHFGVATGKNCLSSPDIKSKQVLASGSWSQNPDTFQTCDELMPCVLSEGLTVANRDFVSNNNVFTVDPTPACAAAGKSVSYSLSDVQQSESDLTFLCNDHENKETDVSLFYEWPDFSNFEDVDQLLRTCDSTYGVGNLGNEIDMCWFSSPTTISGSDAASKSEVGSSNSDSDSLKISSDNSESPQSNNENPAVDAFNKRSADATNTSLVSNVREQSCLTKASSIIEMPTNIKKMDEEKPLKKESCNENSQVEKITMEERSFRQLQEVIEQLDRNTKTRIRDSLYRLARSAEQRYGVVKANKYSREALIAETKCAELMDIETDTNPIDRSIAHLLFHRPNDLSKKSRTDSQSPDDFKVAYT